MSTVDVVTRYYGSQQNKDDKWKELWAEDAVFCDASRTLLAEGREAVIESFTPFLRGVAILEIAQRIVEGDQACSVIHYTYRNSNGETMSQDVAEVAQIRGTRLASLTIYFDLTAYRQFMRGTTTQGSA